MKNTGFMGYLLPQFVEDKERLEAKQFKGTPAQILPQYVEDKPRPQPQQFQGTPAALGLFGFDNMGDPEPVQQTDAQTETMAQPLAQPEVVRAVPEVKENVGEALQPVEPGRVVAGPQSTDGLLERVRERRAKILQKLDRQFMMGGVTR